MRGVKITAYSDSDYFYFRFDHPQMHWQRWARVGLASMKIWKCFLRYWSTRLQLMFKIGRFARPPRTAFVAHKIPPAERDQLRTDLLAYCERDTWAVVKLLERLREIVRSG